jgi:hypothetical protein
MNKMHDTSVASTKIQEGMERLEIIFTLCQQGTAERLNRIDKKINRIRSIPIPEENPIGYYN